MKRQNEHVFSRKCGLSTTSTFLGPETPPLRSAPVTTVIKECDG